MRPTIVRADWRRLLMASWQVDPGVLAPHVPAGTELDTHEGRTLASMVGLRFEGTRLLGLPVPGHRDFPEVNLRFYVRRRVGGEVRRGVVFVKEIVPRRALAWTARALYGEHYVALPMRHEVAAGDRGEWVRYEWRTSRRWNRLEGLAAGEARLPEEGSEEQFVAEHYWGYTRRRGGGTTEYRVEHPTWRLRRAAEVVFDAELAAFYGKALAEALAGPPASAFVAEGSPVLVRWGRRIA